MKKIFIILLWMIFFNVATFAVAALHIFPYSLWGDATTYGLDDPNELPTPEQLFERLVTNTNGSIAKLLGQELRFNHIIVAMAGIGAIVAIATTSMAPFVVGLVGSLFVLMYSNSKTVFDQIASNLGGVTFYIILMIGLGILILFILTAMDYAAGQVSSE